MYVSCLKKRIDTSRCEVSDMKDNEILRAILDEDEIQTIETRLTGLENILDECRDDLAYLREVLADIKAGNKQ
jgi:hypothetical protein